MKKLGNGCFDVRPHVRHGAGDTAYCHAKQNLAGLVLGWCPFTRAAFGYLYSECLRLVYKKE